MIVTSRLSSRAQNHLALEQDTLHVAVALIDNFLELQWLPLARLQLLGITALLVASKFEERFAPHVSSRTARESAHHVFGGLLS